MNGSLLPAPRQEPSGYVLLVMDDPFVRRLARSHVEELGLPVQEGLSVSRALARVRTCAPLLVLLDPWVEHGSGLAFLEALRDLHGGVPVLLVGEESRPLVRDRALALRADGPIQVHDGPALSAWLDEAVRRAPGSGVAPGPGDVKGPGDDEAT